MEATHKIVRLERGETKGSGSPMWRCNTDSGERVNIFAHTDPAKNSAHHFFEAGYSDDLMNLKVGEACEWGAAPIAVEMRKKGDWWEVVAVAPKPAGAEADTLWPDVMIFRRAAQEQVQCILLADDDLRSIDTECTGLRADGEIASIAVVGLRDYVGIDTLVRPNDARKLLRPGKNGKTAADVNGLTAERLENAFPLRAIYGELRHILGGKVVIGYNVWYDLDMLARNVSTCGDTPFTYEAVWDIAPLVAQFIGNWNAGRGWFENVTLDAACEMFGIVRDVTHDAKADALATLELVKAMANAVAERWGLPF